MYRFIMKNIFKHRRCTSEARLDGKVTIVTGSNTGIGKLTAKDFYARGARVILACRDLQKANDAVEEIKSTTAPMSSNLPLGELVIKKLDLNSLCSIKKCALDIISNEKQINILVNNAGVMMCPKGKTEDGFETHIGINHLGHFLFTCLLMPKIIHSAPARIVNVSSLAHRLGFIHFDNINLDNGEYSPIVGYAQSKLANVLFTVELAERLRDKNVNVYSLHPGVVKTELGRHLNRSFIPGVKPIVSCILRPIQKNAEEGAQTTIFCAVDEKLNDVTGRYYSNCAEATSSGQVRKKNNTKRLWEISAEMVNLGDWDPFKASPDELPPMLQNLQSSSMANINENE